MQVLRFLVVHHVNDVDALLRRLSVLLDFAAVSHAVDEVGAREDAGEGVVVLLCEGIVFVIVALGAGHGQPQQRSRQRIDLLSPLLCLHIKAATIVIFMAKPDETQRRQIPGWGVLDQVGCKLLSDELVVWEVVIKCIDHPLAITICVWIKECRIGADLMCLILCIADVVQPHACQAFAKRAALHEFLNQSFIGNTGFIVEKRSHLGRSGGQAGQVKI